MIKTAEQSKAKKKELLEKHRKETARVQQKQAHESKNGAHDKVMKITKK
ncbi:hypothetical protein [Isachenkonia alkalipeptolytica]|nr:hypothetical protein [Isachenkonia alkalipeptolytica]